MKKIALLLTSLLILGCVQQAEPTGLANPASELCIARGGTLELIESTGYCHLPDGAVCEEWALYNGECPAPQASEAPAKCGIYSVGDSWPAGDGCNSCYCTVKGIECSLTTCEPTPSPSPIPSPSPEPVGMQAFAVDAEAVLNDYFNATTISFQQEYYSDYYERWTAEYQNALWPEAYLFEIRGKNDYRLGYGRERSSNNVTVTWDSRGSTDVHWLEFKCGTYQFWASTTLISDLNFYEFVDACTSGCK